MSRKKPVTNQTRAKKTPLCPECCSTQIVPVIHGIPDREQAKQVKAGRAVLADREEWEGLAEWYCKACGCDWSRHSRRFKRTGGVNATRG